MIIKVKHKESGVTLTISTNVKNQPDEPVRPEIYSDISNLFEEDLRRELNSSYGFYGHPITLESTTNLDLHSACRKLSSFEFISVDEAPRANPLPPGAVS